MLFLSLYRAGRFALQGFWRNIWLSVVTILILVLTLVSISIVGGMNVVGSQLVQSLEEKVDVSVYFYPTVEDEDIQNIQYRIESLASVESVTKITKDEALEQFRLRHANDADILQSLDELSENPLGATLVIKAKTIEQYPLILEVLDDPDYEQLIQNRNFEDNQRIVDRLSDISTRVQRAALIVSTIFVVISILIIFNTIRITIYTHRDEIGIMKLVGASNWFIRFPFIIESVLYACFGVVLTLLVIYPIVQVVSPYVQSLFEGYPFDLAGYFSDHFITIILLQLAIALFLSVVSSAVAVGKYLRV